MADFLRPSLGITLRRDGFVDERTFREIEQIVERLDSAWLELLSAVGLLFTAPTSIALNTGTSSDALSDLTTVNDGNNYHIDEVTGVPGFDLEVIFSGLDRIKGIATKSQYAGGHWTELQLYNYSTTTWDTFITIESSNGQNYRYIEIPDESDYLSSNAAKIRFYHPSTGNAAHDLYIDFVAITE